jgi:hypothetical protein
MRIEITVPRGRGRNKPSAAKKSPVKASRRRDDLGRRRKAGGYITFYDLGQRLVGDDYQTVPLGFTGLTSADDLDFAFWETVKAYYLSVADWTTNFKKIEKSESGKYGVAVAVNEKAAAEEYTELSPTAEGFSSDGKFAFNGSLTRVRLNTNGIFYPIDSANLKATALPSYDSPEIGFNLKGRVDLFVMPCFFFPVTQVILPTGPSVPGESVSAGSFAAVPSRSLLNFPGYGSGDSGFSFGSPAMGTAANVDKILLAIGESPFASWFHIVAGGGPVTPSGNVLTVPGNQSSALYQPFVGAEGLALPTGALAAIARRSNELIYLWSKFDLNPTGGVGLSYLP